MYSTLHYLNGDSAQFRSPNYLQDFSSWREATNFYADYLEGIYGVSSRNAKNFAKNSETVFLKAWGNEFDYGFPEIPLLVSESHVSISTITLNRDLITGYGIQYFYDGYAKITFNVSFRGNFTLECPSNRSVEFHKKFLEMVYRKSSNEAKQIAIAARRSE